MKIEGLEFGVVDWSRVDQVERSGGKGAAIWRTVESGEMRLRQVEYAPGYSADHSGHDTIEGTPLEEGG